MINLAVGKGVIKQKESITTLDVREEPNGIGLNRPTERERPHWGV